MSRKSRARGSGLLSREERLMIRHTIEDLERQLDRAASVDDRHRLTTQVANCRLEQAADREGRKRDRKRAKSG